MQRKAQHISASRFQRNFIWLIALTWLVPPFFGMGFLIQIDFFSLDEILTILTNPLEPIFAGGYFLVALVYFRHYAQPIYDYLGNKSSQNGEHALKTMRSFPLHYWGLFLFYLLLAPTSMMVSGYFYIPGFEASPADWFRIHLVALIVSVIVGLPIFFYILNLFGQCVRDLNFTKPHVTITTKVFLIGALTPLLIDTMLVQYYWARTGFFTAETFLIWLLLEVLAIAGSLMFMKSFGQSLQPLHNLITAPYSFSSLRIDNLKPFSTDELGVLAQGYYSLLNDLRVYTSVLDLNNRILSGEKNSETNLVEVVDITLRLGVTTLNGQNAFLFLCDDECRNLLHVASPGVAYQADGYNKLSISDDSLLSEIFRAGQAVYLNDLAAKHPPDQCRIGKVVLTALVAAPLISEGRNIGLVMVSFAESDRRFGQRDLSVIRQLARQITLSLQTYKLRVMSNQAEQLRRDREDQVRLLLNSAAEALIFVDLTGKCLFVNPACVRLLGYKRDEELLGRSIEAVLYHSEQHEAAQTSKMILEVITQGKSFHSSDILHWRADHSAFPVELWVHPVQRDGELYGAVLTFFDISKRKQDENELQQYRDHLEELVKERTQELLHAKQREQQASLAKSEFLSRMSHELRTPLNAISGFAQILLIEKNLNETQQDRIQEINYASQHLLGFINEIVELSRIETGNLKLKLNAIDVHELVEEAQQSVTPLARARQVSLQTNRLQTSVLVQVDGDRFREVLLNLLGKAIKYTEPGKQVSVLLAQPDPSLVRISVIDQGPGIAAEQLDKIFEPFSRLITAPEADQETGLGLSLSKQLIEAMGGRISAVSDGAGSGCRFDVEIPVATTWSLNDSSSADYQAEG